MNFFFYLSLDLRILIVPSSSTCKKFGKEYLLRHKAQGNKARKQQQNSRYLKWQDKAQGAKVATRHEGNTHEGSNKHKSSNKCKSSSKAQSTKAATPAKATTQVKVATRCKSVRATRVKTIARCEAQRH